MSQFTVESAHPVRVDVADDNRLTLRNNGDTLYYKQDSSVSSTSNDGSLTSGQSITLSIPTWIRSASASTVQTFPASDESSFGRTLLNASNAAAAQVVLGIDNTAQLTTALSSGTSVGAMTIATLQVAPPSYGFVVVEPFSTNAEVRQVSSSTTSSVTVSAALKNAHAASSKVFFVQSPAFAASWWGAKGDNSTDDIVPLQNAVRSIADAGFGQTLDTPSLHGAGRVFRISQPLMLPNHCKLQDIVIFARSNYAPADSVSAMGMSYRSSWTTFTVTASDDTFTTPAAHGLSVSTQVVLKGLTGATGVTSGKRYWVKTIPTATTFTLGTDSTIASTLDVTADGSGDIYTNAGAETRQYMQNVYFGGSDIAGVNGLMLNLQQPAHFDSLRVSNCPGNALWLAGQQAVFYNTELTTNGTGLLLDDASFMWFYGYDHEQNAYGCKVVRISETVWGGGSATNCAFFAVHAENNTTADFYFHGSTSGLTIDNNYSTLSGSGIFILSDGGGGSGGSPTDGKTVGYVVRTASFNTTAGQVLIQDYDRGVTKTALHAKDSITEFAAPLQLQDGSVNDEARWQFASQAGGYVRIGGINPSAPKMALRGDTSQTAPVEVWRNTSGTDKLWVDKSGYLLVANTAAPADAALAANQAAVWFDPTNSTAAVNWKAKQADGTVKTGKLPLFQAADTGAQSTTASTQTTPWGFASQAQADAIATHLNDIRTALRNAGLMA